MASLQYHLLATFLCIWHTGHEIFCIQKIHTAFCFKSALLILINYGPNCNHLQQFVLLNYMTQCCNSAITSLTQNQGKQLQQVQVRSLCSHHTVHSLNESVVKTFSPHISLHGNAQKNL